MNNPNCKNCQFAEQVRADKTAIKTVTICKHSPPQLLALPAQDALGRTGVAVSAQWPQMPDDAWCHQFKLRTHVPSVSLADIELN